METENTPDPTPGRRAFSQLALGTVMAAAGLLFVTAHRTSGGDSIRSDASSTADVLRRRERRVTQLQGDVAEKQAQLDELASSHADSAKEDQQQQLTDALGLSDVHGPAVRVTLTDAPSQALNRSEDLGPNDLVVHQQDLQGYVNALWAGGAEAMMLQDRRIVSRSAYRCAGNTLLIDGRVYSPPFVITAIGDPRRLERALDSSPTVTEYRQWVDYVGLGEKVEILEDVTIPAYDGTLTLDSARTT